MPKLPKARWPEPPNPFPQPEPFPWKPLGLRQFLNP